MLAAMDAGPATRAQLRAQRDQSGGPSLPVVVGLAATLLVLIAARGFLDQEIGARPTLQTWLTVFVSIGVQALPFLVLGVCLAAALSAFVPPDAINRWLPRRAAAAVPVAALSGIALPGCECASVPVSGALVRHGVKPAVALTFLLAAPAINPIVLVSTAVAFPTRPDMVVGRLAASLVVAVVVGWVWLARGKDTLLHLPSRHADGGSKLDRFVAEARHDLINAGGFLVIGAAIAASVNVLAPRSWLQAISDHPVLSVAFMAIFAVAIAMCSEADAFVAASMTGFSPTAQLVFMVVGPVIDVKLFAMQLVTFGRRFVVVFAPLTLSVAVIVAVVVGRFLS